MFGGMLGTLISQYYVDVSGCVHACSLTRKQCVGAGQAGPVGGIPPAQPPQAAAALLHWHQGGVVNTRELLAAPRGEAPAACTNTWEGKGRSTKNKSIWRRRKKRRNIHFQSGKKKVDLFKSHAVHKIIVLFI